MLERGNVRAYPPAYVALHWIIAALIGVQVIVGLYMGSLPEDTPAQDSVELTHVALGLTLIPFVFLRLVVRATIAPPPLPAEARWQAWAAKVNHVALYLLLILIPLTGWAMKSFFPDALSFWGLFQWPRLPWFGGLTPEQGIPLYGRINALHIALVWVLIAVLALHLAAVVWHRLVDRPVLWRMAPFLRRR